MGGRGARHSAQGPSVVIRGTGEPCGPTLCLSLHALELVLWRSAKTSRARRRPPR